MDNTLPVYTTPWYDCDNGWLWTPNNTTYTWCFVILGLAFGLVQNSVMRIILRILAAICYSFEKCQRGRSDERRPSDADERQPLMGRNPRRDRSCLSRNSPWNRWVVRVVSALVSLISIAYVIGGSLLANISTGSVALSASKTCGLWALRSDAEGSAQDKDALLQGLKEARAGQYTRNCYSPQHTTSTEQCQLFRQPFIPTSKMETGLQCPFVDKTYCAGDHFSAVRFSTGQVDASQIGVRTQHRPKFNRTSICVPLNMDLNFTEQTDSREGFWGHKLGPVEGDEYNSSYTFEQYGDPFEFNVASYTMSTYLHVFSKTRIQNYWQPLSALTVRNDLTKISQPYSLTIMFLHSCKIFYEDYSADLIFQTDTRVKDLKPDLWYNKDSRARSLACFDWLDLYSNNGSHSTSYKDNPDGDSSFNFTRAALNMSTTFHAIEYRGANGLDAQAKIQGDVSLPLSKDPSQWIVESWALFNTSLARIQYDALDIANGAGHELGENYVRKTEGDMCGIFTFEIPKGYNNIAILPILGILITLFIIGLLGFETGVALEDENRTKWYNQFGKGKLILFERAAMCIAARRERPSQPATSTSHHADQVHSSSAPRDADINEQVQDDPWAVGDSESIDIGPSNEPLELPYESIDSPGTAGQASESTLMGRSRRGNSGSVAAHAPSALSPHPATESSAQPR